MCDISREIPTIPKNLMAFIMLWTIVIYLQKVEFFCITKGCGEDNRHKFVRQHEL